MTKKQIFHQVLEVLREHPGYDFFAYKEPALHRRIQHRMNICQLENWSSYLTFLEKSPVERGHLVDDFLGGTKGFFQHPKQYTYVQQHIFPQLLIRAAEQNLPLKCWVIGCATGEEAYGLAILLQEFSNSLPQPVSFKIVATDIDSKALEMAIRGRYDKSIEKSVKGSFLSQYFDKKHNSYLIKSSIRQHIIFAEHDIMKDPPFLDVDLVSCKNLLIYLNKDGKQHVLHAINQALNPQSYLLLGKSDHIPEIVPFFHVLDNSHKVFKAMPKKNELGVIAPSSLPHLEKTLFSRGSGSTKLLNELLNSELLEGLEVAAALITKEGDILQAQGNLKQYLHFPKEGFSNNLLKLLPDEISISLINGLSYLSRESEKWVQKKVLCGRITEGPKEIPVEGRTSINLRIKRVEKSVQFPTLFLVILQKEFQIIEQENKKGQELIGQPDADELNYLRAALRETRENLEINIAALQEAKEQSEKLQTQLYLSSQQFQRSEEEVELVKEELVLLQEEATRKEQTFQSYYADHNNLLQNDYLGILFLDKSLQIRSFSSLIQKFFPIGTNDIGRPITAFQWNLAGVDMGGLSAEVLESLQPIQRMVQKKEGQWYLMEIKPYRTADDRITGLTVFFQQADAQEHLKRTLIEKTQLEGELKELTTDQTEKDKLLDSLFQVSPSIIYIFDLKEQKNVYTNSTMGQLLGFSPKEVAMLDHTLLTKTMHPDDLPNYVRHLNSFSRTDQKVVKNIEFRIKKKAGDYIWVSSSEKVYEWDEEGYPTRIIGVAKDIRAQKEEQAYLERQKLLITQGETVSNIGSWIYDRITGEMDYSNGYLDIFDWRPEEVKPGSIREQWLSRVHPEDLILVKEAWQVLDAKALPFEINYRITLTDGKIRWIRDTIGQAINRDRFLGTSQDFTEEKELQLEMKSDKEILETLYELSAYEEDNFQNHLRKLLQILSSYFDMDVGVISKIEDLNYKVFVSHSIDDSLQDGTVFPLKETLCDLAVTLDDMVIVNDLGDDKEKKTYAPFQKRKLRSYIGIPIKIEGKLFGTLNFGCYAARERAILEKEQNLIKTSSIWISKIIERNVMLQQLEHTVDKLENANEELERFAYIASHDMKEPLNTINSFIELFKMDYLTKFDEQAHEYFDFIESSSSRMKDLIGALLNYSLLGKNSFQVGKVDCNEVVGEVCKDLGSVIQAKQAKLQIDALPLITADRTQIKQLFQSLVSNGIKYSKDKNVRVDIGVKEKRELWEFYVKDNGIGISEEQHKKIFEVFRRLHHQKDYPGTGIGLANCLRIVNNHKGQIWVESELGKGSTFYFTIPKKIKNEEEE